MHENNDLKNFNTFYQREYRDLLGFIKRKSKLDEDAWDILQESFFVLYKRVQDEKCSEYTRDMLYGIAKKIISKWCRRNKVREKYSIESKIEFNVSKLPIFYFQPSLIPSPEDILFEKQRLEILAKAFSSLNERDQQFVGLRFTGDSNKAIGDQFNISYINIGVSVNRAISRLIKIFSKGMDKGYDRKKKAK